MCPINPTFCCNGIYNIWSNIPITGSYVYPSSSRQGDYTTIIHFPAVDLELIYAASTQKEGSDRDERTSSMKPQHSSTTIKRPILFTRKGNKYSQEEQLEEDQIVEAYRQPNQDRILVLSRYSPSSSEKTIHGKEDFWIGIFDGHGPQGQCISQYSSLQFAKRIQHEWDLETKLDGPPTRDQVKDTLRKMFLGINESMPNLYGSGSTGISIWRRGNDLFISNVGDSVAFVASYYTFTNGPATEPKVEIIYMTQPHKPDLPNERARIKASGGIVEDSPYEGGTARLVIPMPDGVEAYGLAMSRSLGDLEGSNYGLIAEPTIDVLDMTEFDTINKEYMVVAATDGIIDHGRLSPLEVATTIAKGFLSGGDSAMIATEKLVVKASEMWAADSMLGGYRDDESIAIQRLETQHRK